MRWFIKKDDDGQYYAGDDADKAFWISGRKGAVVFQSESSAQARIDELELRDAQPEEY